MVLFATIPRSLRFKSCWDNLCPGGGGDSSGRGEARTTFGGNLVSVSVWFRLKRGGSTAGIFAGSFWN